MRDSPNRSSNHPDKSGEQSDQRSSGEEAAHREEVQQHADIKKQSRPGERSDDSQNRRGQRDQDDGGQSGHIGRDQNSR